MAKVKCPWCGRMVEYSKKQRLGPHVQSGRVKCVGVGQTKETVDFLREGDAKRGKI